MWTRLPVGVFLVLHAVVFTFLAPGSWLFDGGRGLFLALGGAAAVALGLGALLLVARRGPWRPLLGGGAAISLVQLILFFELALVVGVAIDVAILAALLWTREAAVAAPRATAGHGTA